MTDMIDAQVNRRATNVTRRGLETLTYRDWHRTGKRQCHVQIGSRDLFYPFPQQFGGGLRQGGSHRVIRPQGKKKALTDFSLP
jgi:hypothetical protein